MVNVIVIDDDKDTIQSLRPLLEIHKIHVLAEGYNGEDAYNLYFQHKPDFVILDMKMPEYDGNYAIEKIKKEDPNAKIIIASGFSDVKFDKSKVVTTLTKPYPFEILLDVLINKYEIELS